MQNYLLNNESLQKFIAAVDINQEHKDFLLSKLPQMDLEERIALLNTLRDIYLLALEEKEAVERIKRFLPAEGTI